MSRGAALPIAFAIFFGIVNGIAIFKPLLVEERIRALKESGVVPPEVEAEPLERKIDIVEKLAHGQPPPPVSLSAKEKEKEEELEKASATQPKMPASLAVAPPETKKMRKEEEANTVEGKMDVPTGKQIKEQIREQIKEHGGKK